jgi:small-conductance mechanosensitive channel
VHIRGDANLIAIIREPVPLQCIVNYTSQAFDWNRDLKRSFARWAGAFFGRAGSSLEKIKGRRAMDGVLAWLNHYNIRFETVLTTLGLLIAASIVILILNRLTWRLLRGVEQRAGVSYEALLTITRLIASIFWIVAILLILNLWGVSVSGLWTLLVSAAAVIGVGFLAVWTIISNITASFFITIWRPFHLGHTIELLPENLKGRVVDRNMMFTIVREEGGALLQIPNNLFFQKMFRVFGSRELSYFEYLENRSQAKPSGMPVNQ